MLATYSDPPESKLVAATKYKNKQTKLHKTPSQNKPMKHFLPSKEKNKPQNLTKKVKDFSVTCTDIM